MEKEIIETYRFDPNDFTDGVKEDGTNLYKDIQESAKKYFDKNKIKWWSDADETKNGPHGTSKNKEIKSREHKLESLVLEKH